MAGKRTRKRPSRKPKTFRFQLDYPGIAGIVVVSFCLFLWMFLLGIWAGQTILLSPCQNKSHSVIEGRDLQAKRVLNPVETISPSGKKKHVE